MPDSHWTEVGLLSSIPIGIRTFKHDAHQVAIVRTEDGKLHAVDNRCPHEGYPLAQGDLKGSVLTCAWHNWKFEVSDGRCILGGEGVRSYPVRERDGVLEIDLAEPDPAGAIPGLIGSMGQGLFDHDNGRALRDAVRLLLAGYPAHQLLADVAADDARRGEYGSTHVLALAADCGRLLARYRGTDAVVAIAPVIDLCGETDRRLPARRQPEPVAGGDARTIRAAVDAEEGDRAEALLLGAFDAGVPRGEIERWMLGMMADHFTDFGHELIYAIKGRELLDRLPPATASTYARAIYPALLYATLVSTREDTLPYMRPYFAGAARGAAPPCDHAAVVRAQLDGTRHDAVAAVEAGLAAGVAPHEIARSLSVAAAHRVLRFDTSIERSPEVQETWLWVTHRLTFASAVRNALEIHPSADDAKLLRQAVAFIHSGKPMDAQPSARPDVTPLPATLDAILDAVLHRHSADAVRRAAGYLERGGDPVPLEDALLDYCLQDPLVRPIHVCHLVKTTIAAFEERAALGASADRDVPVLAAVRFLSSPVVERRVHQAARASIAWVAEGITPRKLTQ
ncbi:MAG: Rieske (2Fe-2S) protein [Acidobacteriota bacterium]